MSENWKKNQTTFDLPSGFWPLASCGAPACTWMATVLRIHEGEVAAASAYLRFRGLI